MNSKFILAGLYFFLAISGCNRELEIFPSDDFAGKSVTSSVDAEGLVMKRLGNAPVAGEKAPDGMVYDPATGKPVNMKSLWSKKPAVLIFGSGSCTSTNLYNADFETLAKRFADNVDFKIIYIREAHPVNGFQPMLEGEIGKLHLPPITDQMTQEERCTASLEYQNRAKFSFQMLADSVDDMAAVRWSAWPTRVFVVGTNGNVLYAGDQGPWFFSILKEGWHTPPNEEMDMLFKKRPYDRISLEEFLENNFGS